MHSWCGSIRGISGSPSLAGWSDGRWALTLTLLAWAQRIAFLLSNRDRAWGFSIFYEGDAERFHLFARAILHRGRLLLARDPEARHAWERDVQLLAADLAAFLERARRLRLESLSR